MPNDTNADVEITELGCLVWDAQRLGGAALERLLATVRPRTFAFFARRFPADHAEDLTQIALLKLANTVMRIDFRRVDLYVGTIVHNLCRTAYRRRRREEDRHTDIASMDVMEPRPLPDAVAERAELMQVIRHVAITSLPADLAALLFSVLEGESTAELAVRYQVSPVTIRTRLARVRVVLRRELTAYVNVRPARHSKS
jgi:RNA polymerase sigma factor (sigma-70 family)